MNSRSIKFFCENIKILPYLRDFAYNWHHFIMLTKHVNHGWLIDLIHGCYSKYSSMQCLVIILLLNLLIPQFDGEDNCSFVNKGSSFNCSN